MERHDLHQPATSLTTTRAMNFGEFRNGKAQQPLPPSLTPHEAEVDHFSTLCSKTSNQILTLLALGLGVLQPPSPQNQADNALTPTDRPQLLRHAPRPSEGQHGLDPALPLLPVDILGRHRQLPARRGRARRRTLRLREHHAALPATRAAGARDPDAGGNLGAGPRAPAGLPAGGLCVPADPG